MRGRGAPAAARPTPTAGPRPSFQYRDGAFICDLCKKSFSDGNDMVAHWKSHVKQQQQAGKGGGRDSGYAVEKSRPSAADSGRGRGRGRSAGRPVAQGRGAAKTHTTSRGRPITSKQAGRKRRAEAKKVKKGRSDKGKPRWTAYLVWSTRRRQEIKVEYPGYGFAEVGKLISEEWKEITPDDLEKYKVEAERMNAANVRKLPKVTESGDEDWSENDDPSFNEANRKPIMLKIKKENERAAAESRSGRKRKRPSFFQEFENEESNLDKILDDFEQEQLEESKFPKPKRAVKNPGSRPRQRRRIQEDEYDDDEEEVELETTRSGRVRKVAKPTRQFHFPDEDVDDDSGNDEEKDEYQPDSEFEEPEEDDDDEGVPEQLEVSGKGRRSRKRSITLPPKKRSHAEKSGGGKAGMTEDEIKKATMAALAAKPIVIGLDRIKKKLTQSEEERAAAKPSWVVDEEDIDDDAGENKPDETSGGENPADDATLNTPNPGNNPDDEDMDDMERNDNDNPLEGSVTEDDPPENMFGDDDDDEINPEPSKSDEQLPEESGGGDEEVAEPDANEQNQEESAAPEEFQSQEQVEDHQVGGGQVDLDVDPFSANVVNSASNDDLLSSAADTSTMEAGDEQYKSLIAESQMDNIFN